MDNADIEDIFASLGHITIKRMFGGKGMYRDGVIIAVDLFDEVMLKADEQTAPEFAQAGSRQWVYQRDGKSPVAMPYWSIPDDAYDDPELMARWVRLAHEAGMRAGPSKPKKKRSEKVRKHGAGEG